MTAVIAVCQAPLGMQRALGARLTWCVPGIAGVMAAYSYFPKPSTPDAQNVAGAPRQRARGAAQRRRRGTHRARNEAARGE
jgi:hypothetical protein